MIIDTSLMQRFIRVIIDANTVLGKSSHLDDGGARADGTDGRLLLVRLVAMNGVVDDVELKLLPALDDTLMLSNGNDPEDGGVLVDCGVVGKNISPNRGGGGSGGGGGEWRRGGIGGSAFRSS